MQVNAGQRLEHGFDLRVDLVQDRSVARFDELRQFRIEGFGRVAVGQQQIGIQVRDEVLRIPAVIRSPVDGVDVERFEGPQETEGHMGIARHVFHDAGYGQVVRVIDPDHLAQGFLVSEVPGRRGFGHDHRIGGVQGRVRVAVGQFEVEHVQHAGVREVETRFVEPFVAFHVRDLPGDQRRFDARVFLHLRKGVGQHPSPGRRAPRGAGFRPVHGLDRHGKPVDPVVPRRVLVVAEFVLDVQQDQDATRHPHREAQDVDHGVSLVAQGVSIDYREVVPEHDVRVPRCGQGYGRIGASARFSRRAFGRS